MSVNVKALTTASAIVAAVSYSICALLVAVAPQGMATLGSYILHMNLESIWRSVTLQSGIIGGVLFTLIVAVLISLTGWIYNRLSADRDAEETAPDKGLHIFTNPV